MKNNRPTSINNRQHLNTNRAKGPIIKKWATVAINQENKRSNNQKWKNEPTSDFQFAERLRRIRFCRKHGKSYPELNLVADCLEQCERNNRCFSGACPECGRLFQRFYVRQVKGVVRDIIAGEEGQQLIALSIIPRSGIVRPGRLSKFNIANYQRRIKTALNSIGVKSVIGGIDISFNEDRENKWQPYICLHPYLIAATDDRERLRHHLKRAIPKSTEVPRPVKVPLFENTAYRRSYSLKMSFSRRISNTKPRKGGNTNCRNTTSDKLRVDQRIQLIRYLHGIGFAARVIFRGIKAEVVRSTVRFRKVERIR